MASGSTPYEKYKNREAPYDKDLGVNELDTEARYPRSERLKDLKTAIETDPMLHPHDRDTITQSYIPQLKQRRKVRIQQIDTLQEDVERTPVEEAAHAGYSQEEVQTYLSQKSLDAKAAGYTDEEIHSYIKDNVVQQPAFNDTPVKVDGHTNLAKATKAPTTLLEAIQTGYGWSTIGLGREMLKGTEGHLPEMAVDEETPWYLRGAANLTTTAIDVPAMIAGGAIGGGPRSPVTAMGGAFALPMGLRKVFIDAITNREVGTRSEFAQRVLGTMWETSKGWITGAATAGIGKLASEAVSALPGAAKAILPTAAELATLTEVSARLEGHAPEPKAFLDNAIVLGVAKAVLPSWANTTPPKVLADIYTQTGIPPQHVTGDAIKGNAGVWQDVLDGRIPDAYKQGIETKPSAPTQTQRTAMFQRYEEPGVPPGKPDKPHGLYVSPADIQSPHAELGGERTLWNLKPEAKILHIEEYPGRSVAIRRDAIGAGAGVHAAKKLLGDETFERLRQGSKADAVAFATEKYPGPDYTRYTDKQEVIEAIGAQEARKQGYDAINMPDKSKFGADFSEAVLLNERMAEQVKPGKEQKEFRTPPLTPEQEAQARAFLEQPFAEIPQAPNEPSRPTHMNYNRIQTTDDAKMALSQLSTIYEAKINEQRKSPWSWNKSHQESAQVLADLLQSDPKTVTSFLKGEKAGPSTTAQLLARKELTLGFTEDLMRSRAGLMAKGDQATPEDLAGFLSQVERVSNVQAAFLGQRADVGRALNALKSTKRDAERSQAILDAINSYGGPENVTKLVELLGEYDNPAQVIKFAKEATKATKWEMVVEAWKAGLVSGLRTNEVNFLSTAAFTALRLPTEAIASVYGMMGKAEDRVVMAEIPARIMGMTAGIRDGFATAGAILRTGDNIMGPKTESFEPKIPGTTGEVVRLPFRFMSASDALLKSVNERGEMYAQATKQATLEGQTFGSPAFFGRVADLVANPTEAMTTASHDAALRYTFNRPLGPGGQAFARTVKAWHLEWMFPFITTPGNIFKETARMTPGANLAVKEWRADYEAGGGRRAKALAEVTVGAAIMAAVVGAVQNGDITGNGQPDKKMRATDRAAGWKPYAVKMNGQYIDGYLRMAPIGPLIGLTVDGAEIMQYMTGEEREQWGRMIAFAFASNVTNQTFMTGATNFINVLQDPSRYGQNYVESLAASVVPSIIGQTAADMDPLLREIHGMRDAIIARIPWQREGLMSKKDWTGTAIASPERLWWGSPFTVSAISTDKVRTEASRLGFATPDIPRAVDVIPGKDFGKLDKVQLTPEQRDVFNTESGQFAYQELQKIVNAPDWDRKPAMVQRMYFEKVFQKGRMQAEKHLLEQVTKEQRDAAIKAAEASTRKK